MKKEKFKIEYVFDKGSKNTLWPWLATSSGLAEWFADDVNEDGKNFIFYWENYPSYAELLGISPYVYIRFHWEEEDPHTFFEFRLHDDELTGAWVLEITDFAEPGEKEQAITLWDTQIKELSRKLGL
ncbi:MAG: hypothetical protein LIO93_00875 [Bacteroidales bacterium]|nr:hypothetical protein [Bacteroidales bacterium]